MASATRKTVEKTITEDVIVLELTKEEADGLRAVLTDFDGFEDYTGNIGNLIDLLGNPTETDDRPIEVGDKVRVLKAIDSECNGRIGVVGEMDGSSIPYRVDFSDGEYEWAYNVERVND
jgi:hypothetical protein